MREIRAILRGLSDITLLDLNDVGIAPSDEEDAIEAFETFEENALAKAQYFHRISGLPTLADDSGLEVDALQGKPGVRSRRFAPVPEGVRSEDRDRANNEHLLTLLGSLDLAERRARYICVAAFISASGEASVFRGRAEGLILGRPRGRGGFGYDPLFFDPTLGRTFAELSPEEKDARSHRGNAFRLFASALPGLVSST